MDADRIDEVVLSRVTEVAKDAWGDVLVDDVRVLPGGTSSVTYRASITRRGCPTQLVVVKMAPPGLPAEGNRDVLRQAGVLKALHGTSIPVPQVLLEDASDPPVFVMEYIQGQSYEPLTDILDDPPAPDLVASRARAAARLLAQLHALNSRALVPQESPISIADELARWTLLFDTVDNSICPERSGLGERLQDSLPADTSPVLLHGDFRLGNLLFRDDVVTGVIDWEIAAVGDARVDLAWLLIYTDPPFDFEDRDEINERSGAGMPDSAALLDAYELATGSATPSIEWFVACGLYKSAAVLASFAKRNRRRSTPSERWLRGERKLPAIVERAHRVLDNSPT